MYPYEYKEAGQCQGHWWPKVATFARDKRGSEGQSSASKLAHMLAVSIPAARKLIPPCNPAHPRTDSLSKQYACRYREHDSNKRHDIILLTAVRTDC